MTKIIFEAEYCHYLAVEAAVILPYKSGEKDKIILKQQISFAKKLIKRTK